MKWYSLTGVYMVYPWWKPY